MTSKKRSKDVAHIAMLYIFAAYSSVYHHQSMLKHVQTIYYTEGNSLKTLDNHLFLFAGTSHPALAQEIAANAGIKLGKIAITKFPDGETGVEILDSVRGCDVFVLQTVAIEPNHYLMELLIIIDALKRASAKSITAVIPYYGYCRQDRKTSTRAPITAKLVANLIEKAGANHVVTMDLHAPQVQGFFDVPVDDLQACPVLLEALGNLNFDDYTVVTPDIGSVKLARAYANISGVEYVIIDKSRTSATEVSVLNLYGEVRGKNVLLIDDICSTAGTLVAAAKACQEGGAKRIIAMITHGVFVNEAIEKIEASPIETIVISNTIPLTSKALNCKKMIVVSVAKLFSKAILCIMTGESMTSTH